MVDSLADVSQVDIDLDPFLGHIFEFRLDPDNHHAVVLDNFGLPLSELWNEESPAQHLHVFVKLPSSSPDMIPLQRHNRDEWPYGWDQLDGDSTWKRFYDYWRKQDAEATRNRAYITLAYEERGKEDPEYRLPLAPKTKNKIIVRDCYKHFYDYIMELRDSNCLTGLILTGPPGTGAPSS